jgi:hypothetical protein
MPQEDIKWALTSLKERAAEYKLCRDYYNGAHRLDFIPADFRRDFAALLRRARLNMCPAVVTAVRDRLKLTGLTGDKNDQQLKDDISAIWRRNRMEQRAGEIHLESLITGDSYVIVWPSTKSGEVTFYPQYAEMVTVEYDDEEPDLIIRAAKWWKLKDERVALTLYYPDMLENYETRNKVRGGELQENSFEEADENPIVMNQYGRVPVFHFGNGAGVGGFGVSELHDAIPVQDGLNKTIRDGLIGGESMALPQRYATGVEMTVDSNGQPVNTWIPGDFWVSRNPEAKYGQLEAADLAQLDKVKSSYKEDMAIVTGIPLHYFSPGTGTPPSGEALKTMEFRLASKVEDRQVTFGDVWEQAVKFGLQINGRTDVELDAIWKDTTPRNDVEYQTGVIERVEKLGMPKDQAFRELDYTDEEIERFMMETSTQPGPQDVKQATDWWESNAPIGAKDLINAINVDTVG